MRPSVRQMEKIGEVGRLSIYYGTFIKVDGSRRPESFAVANEESSFRTSLGGESDQRRIAECINTLHNTSLHGLPWTVRETVEALEFIIAYQNLKS